jgi:hypothetical protein
VRKWTPEENDRFLDMIDNKVIGDNWSAKGEEKAVTRSSGEKKSWTAIVCHSSLRWETQLMATVQEDVQVVIPVFGVLMDIAGILLDDRRARILDRRSCTNHAMHLRLRNNAGSAR